MRLLCSLLLSACALLASGELSNRRAPGFTLPDINYKYYDLQDYRGKIVIVDIMKTECPHCQALSRTLERVKAKYGDKLVVLSVVNPPDTGTSVMQYMRILGTTSTFLLDCGQMAASYLKATPQKPAFDVPHLFLIDGNGWIRNDFAYDVLTRPIFEGDGLFAEIDKLLAPSKK